MTDCESMWLAIRIGWTTLGLASAAGAFYFLGYRHGQRANNDDAKIDRRTVRCAHCANQTCEFCS